MKTTRHDSFAAYVLPSVLAFALSGLYTIVDGFFIGQSLGDLGLAAITLAYPAAALQAVGTGIGLAGAIRCTILQARGEEQTPRTCFSGTVLLLLATSAAFAAVLLGLLGPVLTVLGAQDEARPLAAEYIRVIAYGTAFQILATGLVPFIRNLGGLAFAMVAMGTGFVTNIALDYLFVWEFHWGMAGGAWATVIGQAATMLLAIGYLVRRRVGFVPPKAGEVLPLWGALLKVAAAPIGLTFSPNITLMVMNHFLLRYGGALAIAVYGCIDYVLSTIYMLLQGVGDGSQPLISRTYGAGDFGELRRTGARAYRAAFGITAVCIVALFLTRSVIGVLFGASAEANAGVTARLPLFLATLPLLAYTRVTIAYFYATEKTALSYVLVFSEPVLTFAVLLILPQLFKLTGVWLAIPAAQALTFCIAVPARRRARAQESFRREPQTAKLPAHNNSAHCICNGRFRLIKNLVEFRRRSSEEKPDHFPRRHVRLGKYFSACKRTRRPLLADGACAACPALGHRLPPFEQPLFQPDF